MKFITNSMSPLMFIEDSLTLDKDKLQEDEFYTLIKGAESYVSQFDVAERIGVPVNTHCLKARAGDIILQAVLQSNGAINYFIWRIRESEAPLLRSYETTEEMA